MKRHVSILCFLIGVTCVAGVLVASDARERYMAWEVHDKHRPHPAAIDPGFAGSGHFTGKAPSDAVVLFDGSNLDAFRTGNDKPIPWPIEDHCFMIKPGTGDLYTKRSFGDMQLHVEYMIPGRGDDKTGMNNGNSGIYIMGKYEIQIINNKMPDLHADGMAGAIYGQFPPMADPDRGLNQWQSYDIIFERPHFDEMGNLLKPAYATILLNGVLVQNHQELMGPTYWDQRSNYIKHADALPILIQNHADEVYFRNIWVREIGETDQSKK